MWQDTKELGIGQAKSADGKIFVVARYRPAGNFINHFQDNVKPRVRRPCSLAVLSYKNLPRRQKNLMENEKLLAIIAIAYLRRKNPQKYFFGIVSLFMFLVHTMICV